MPRDGIAEARRLIAVAFTAQESAYMQLFHMGELEEDSPEYEAKVALMDAHDALYKARKALDTSPTEDDLELENEVAGDP